MKLTLARDHFAVFDDVLVGCDFEELGTFVERLPFRSVHAEALSKVWRVHDGNPFRTVQTAFYQQAEEALSDPNYATLLRQICDSLSLTPQIITQKWDKLSFTGWVYPRGTGLSLHVDGRQHYSGAYIFYSHPYWHHNWGGHLLVLDPSVTKPSQVREWLRAEPENQEVMAYGICDCVMARPNRLVLISPEAYHLVTRVDESAGQISRTSIAGFFHRRHT